MLLGLMHSQADGAGQLKRAGRVGAHHDLRDISLTSTLKKEKAMCMGCGPHQNWESPGPRDSKLHQAGMHYQYGDSSNQIRRQPEPL